jgi:hypothetical protein
MVGLAGVLQAEVAVGCGCAGSTARRIRVC